MKDNIFKILVCPECKGDLDFASDTEYSCSSCLTKYPCTNDTVNFIPSSVTFSVDDSTKNNFSIKEFLNQRIQKLKFHLHTRLKSRVRIPNLINSLKPDEISINVGAGNTNYSPKIINLDVEETNNGDIIADGKSLPIRSDSVSLKSNISSSIRAYASDKYKYKRN